LAWKDKFAGNDESAPKPAPTAAWLDKLAALRLSLTTGKPGADLQGIIDDSRGDR